MGAAGATGLDERRPVRSYAAFRTAYTVNETGGANRSCRCPCRASGAGGAWSGANRLCRAAATFHANACRCSRLYEQSRTQRAERRAWPHVERSSRSHALHSRRCARNWLHHAAVLRIRPDEGTCNRFTGADDECAVYAIPPCHADTSSRTGGDDGPAGSICSILTHVAYSPWRAAGACATE